MVDTNARTLLARDPVGRALGIVVEEVTAGRARVRMQVTTEMANIHGIAHGGYLFLLADTAFAYACNGPGSAAVAQGAHVTFLRPAMVGEELVAEAVERTRYGPYGIYDVAVRRPLGEVVAEFRGQNVELVRGRAPGRPHDVEAGSHG